MVGETFKLSGHRELAANLAELGKATGKNTLRRVGRAMLEPMAEVAKAKVRQRSGRLWSSIHVGTRLAPSQRGARGRHVGGGKFRATAKNSVTIHMGPGQHPQAITEEFGTIHQAPHPFMRPAFDAEAPPAVRRAGGMLWDEISKAAARRARRLAKKAAKR